MIKINKVRRDSTDRNKTGHSKRVCFIIILLSFFYVSLHGVNVNAKIEELSAKFVRQQKDR